MLLYASLGNTASWCWSRRISLNTCPDYILCMRMIPMHIHFLHVIRIIARQVLIQTTTGTPEGISLGLGSGASW